MVILDNGMWPVDYYSQVQTKWLQFCRRFCQMKVTEMQIVLLGSIFYWISILGVRSTIRQKWGRQSMAPYRGHANTWINDDATNQVRTNASPYLFKLLSKLRHVLNSQFLGVHLKFPTLSLIGWWMCSAHTRSGTRCQYWVDEEIKSV